MGLQLLPETSMGKEAVSSSSIYRQNFDLIELIILSREKWNGIGKDKLIVHAVPSGKTIANGSPYVLKVLTYLRITKIPYEVSLAQCALITFCLLFCPHTTVRYKFDSV